MKMNPGGTPQQLCSTLVTNMKRLSHLQLFGREHLEKRAYLNKNSKCRFEKLHHQVEHKILHRTDLISSPCSEMNPKVALQAP